MPGKSRWRHWARCRAWRDTGTGRARRECPCLFPQDAVLNLPPRGYSWQLQQLAVTFTRSGAYEQAREFIEAATGITIGKKQLEQITAEAAADAPGSTPPWPGSRTRARKDSSSRRRRRRRRRR